MANAEYNYHALDKVFKMSDSELAHEFLVKKTAEEIKKYDEFIKSLPEDKRKRVVDPFVNAHTIMRELKTAALKNNDILPTVSTIDDIELAYFAQALNEKYRIVIRNPRKYKLNYEMILMYYDELLLDNWEVFDKERLEIIEYFKKRGETMRTRTPIANTRLIAKIAEAISTINLENVHEL